ncbi:uncharacterized protein [Cherax quadricarinatus]
MDHILNINIMSCLLCWMMMLWTPAFPASFAYKTQSLDQHYVAVSSYPFSKIVGVFRVLDEASCSCVSLSSQCPLEITQKSALKATGFSCPVQTRYCCRRKTLLDLSKSIKSNLITAAAKTRQHSTSINHNLTTILPANLLIPSNASRPTTTIPRQRQHFTKTTTQTRRDRSGWRPSTLDTLSKFTGYKGIGREINSSSQHTLVTIEGDSVSRAPLAAIAESRQGEEHPRSENVQRRPKMVACSCMTRDDCVHSWSLFTDLPEVEIRTSLECEGPDEFTCCLGRVLPSRAYNTGEEHRSRPTIPAVWRPLETAWESLISWFSG